MGKQLFDRQQKAQVVPFFQNGSYYYRRALKAYRVEHNLEKASKLLKRAAALEPDNSNFLSQLAMIYTEMGNYQESNEILTDIMEKVDPTMIDCHYFMANNYAHLGLFHQAYKSATAYSTEAPDGDFIEDNEELLDLLMIEGEDEDPSFEDSDELIIKQETARSLLENGKLDEAIALLHEIIEEFPEFWSAYNNLSLAYFYSGNVEKAKHYLELVLELNEGNLHALCNLLVFYYYERKDPEVHALTERLSIVHPIMVEHRYKLGATFALIGKYDLAFKWLRSLQRQGFEGDDTFFYWLSYSAWHLGQEELAKSAWARVIRENPSKAGSEPWENRSSLKDMSLQERLTLVYIASKSNQLEEIRHHHALKPQSELEKEFLKQTMTRDADVSSTGARLFFAAEALKHQLGSIEEKTFLSFFEMMLKANAAKLSLKNSHAWSAAFYYLFKQKSGERVTKTEAAHAFGVTVSTLTKYERLVQSL
ncbi:tetratricopeptide repeat protein [Bacillus sp. FJAT-42376]|uniref:tetratricopeptide repeat protein n=1 Tax=Bacillus sp. FJAT-42376 TaxID=2014076 RepID=UPI001F150F51|nr:tetratricopeptide repeat protein [Bacillus sp. FJAT-42376]